MFSEPVVSDALEGVEEANISMLEIDGDVIKDIKTQRVKHINVRPDELDKDRDIFNTSLAFSADNKKIYHWNIRNKDF